MTSPQIALCLPGGGITGAMYQIGALCALEDAIGGFSAHELDLYVGSSSGSTVAVALAGGLPASRLYRALLDPADNYFPLERSHLLRMDLDEWRRTLTSAARALGQGARSLASRGPAPTPSEVWEQLDRFYDSLPAGLFTLDAFERFLESVCVRRGVPGTFPAMPRPLRVVAHDLDSGERVCFGDPGRDDVPVVRAVCASLALPLFYSPVRIGDRQYIDGSLGRAANLDLAVSAGAQLVIVVNPMVPVRAASGNVPTGHGRPASVRDKGAMWVYNQAMRIGVHARLDEAAARADADLAARGALPLLRIEPDPSDAVLFLHHPASFSARRTILEWSYRTTRDRVRRWVAERPGDLARLGWSPTPAR
jgi:predicted acylesterase/phospholipase RssA